MRTIEKIEALKELRLLLDARLLFRGGVPSRKEELVEPAGTRRVKVVSYPPSIAAIGLASCCADNSCLAKTAGPFEIC